MIKGLIGIKLGMTRIFGSSDTGGNVVPVTLIQVKPNPVVQIKTKDRDAYDAVQVGYGDIKEKNATNPLLGHFKRANLKPYKWLREFRVDKIDNFQLGNEIKVDIFSVGDYVDVSGTTKGKGFAGVMKRHNFAGGPKTHGQSNRQRSPGAIGSQRPQRVLKGKKMPGHMGNVWKTVQRLEVVKVIPDKNLIALKGSVPGSKHGLLVIQKTTRPKKPKLLIEAERHKPKGKGKAPKELK